MRSHVYVKSELNSIGATENMVLIKNKSINGEMKRT